MVGCDGLVSVNDLVTGWAGYGDYNSHEFTALGAALQSHLGIDYRVWTSDDFDSCGALVVSLSHGNVGFSDRNHFNYGLNYLAVYQ